MTFMIPLLFTGLGFTVITFPVTIYLVIALYQATNNSSNTLQSYANISLTPNILRFQNVCSDFYQVACGRWEEEHPLSNETESITTFDQAQMNIDNYFWGIISDYSYSSGDSRLQTARTFYRSCIHSRSLDAMRLSYYRLINKYFGEWKLIRSILQQMNFTNDGKQNIDNMSLTDLFLPIISQTGDSLLFSLNINKENLTIDIAPGLSFVDLNTNSTERDEFEQSFYRTAIDLGVPESERRKLTDSFEMMQELTRKIQVSGTLPLVELRRNITVDGLNSICPQINWSYVFEKVLQDTGYENYTNLPISLQGQIQLETRCTQYDFAMKNNKSTLQTMIIMDFLFQQLTRWLKPHTLRIADNLNSSSQLYFDVQCMKRLREVLPWTLERHYLHSHVNETHKNEIIEMFREVKFTLKNLLLNITWLDAQQKATLIDKIHKVKLFALYSDYNTSERKENISTIYKYLMKEDDYYLNEYHILKANYVDKLKTSLFNYQISLTEPSTITPRVYYRRDENRVYFNAGLMQLPFYSYRDDFITKFERFGHVLSHELLHVLDIQSALYDANGNKNSMEYATTFVIPIYKASKCLRDQFRAYASIIHKIEEIATIDEIISDNGGLTVSYNTYRRLLMNNANNVSQDSNSTLASNRSFFFKFAEVSLETLHNLNYFCVLFLVSGKQKSST
ncbi:Neprilysin-11 isoform 2 [Schistosoma japonicum]|uniref:Neprilysin-11 isoform 2 n=1 Tax=Schistosoma japonicum TaxID=6182 RepID=A0A4Z2D0R0_SCHJA|nr:Neprilysin-11 isoform 2 [Schistosoma japonicum]